MADLSRTVGNAPVTAQKSGNPRRRHDLQFRNMRHKLPISCLISSGASSRRAGGDQRAAGETAAIAGEPVHHFFGAAV